MKERGGKPKKPAKSNWIRTGGYVGDESMEMMEKFNREGSGVSDEVRNVGSDPNDDIHVEGAPREGVDRN